MLKTKSSGDCLPGFPNKKCQLCKEPCEDYSYTVWDQSCL